ncbi:hypothetical protein [Streptomyces sp. MMG1121]|uniref:hypothetical protein n=1 Tax=Streptomyces sp. MMG1121 TaxID=1415544 RepID=UPI0006AE70C4|nr:hypothetical protein [Streptomyces sp. MMG1121]KOV57980.1 hypothetical protein ADK64_37665 [Streptomyces sp. MMG1121]
MTVRLRTIPLVLVAAGAALTLTACQGGSGNDAAAPSSAGASPATTTPGSGSSKNSSGAGSSSGTDTGGAAAQPGSKDATLDSYAYKHPCAAEQLAVSAKSLDSSPNQYVVSVANHGKAACGLSSYYPVVDLGSKDAADRSHDIRPLVPGGLGGAPAVPVHAGHTVYAVLDTDPIGAKGSNGGFDEINVLADKSFPNADTLNFPLATGAIVVRHPKLGLYRNSISDAVASMRTANTSGS